MIEKKSHKSQPFCSSIYSNLKFYYNKATKANSAVEKGLFQSLFFTYKKVHENKILFSYSFR